MHHCSDKTVFDVQLTAIVMPEKSGIHFYENQDFLDPNQVGNDILENICLNQIHVRLVKIIPILLLW